jgi:hypothetical protein
VRAATARSEDFFIIRLSSLKCASPRFVPVALRA